MSAPLYIYYLFDDVPLEYEIPSSGFRANIKPEYNSNWKTGSDEIEKRVMHLLSLAEKENGSVFICKWNTGKWAVGWFTDEYKVIN